MLLWNTVLLNLKIRLILYVIPKPMSSEHACHNICGKVEITAHSFGLEREREMTLMWITVVPSSRVRLILCVINSVTIALSLHTFSEPATTDMTNHLFNGNPPSTIDHTRYGSETEIMEFRSQVSTLSLIFQWVRSLYISSPSMQQLVWQMILQVSNLSLSLMQEYYYMARLHGLGRMQGPCSWTHIGIFINHGLL